MREPNKELVTYVEDKIIPQYRFFDRAHQTDHVAKVIDQSLAIAQHYQQADIDMVYCIAAYHDVGMCEGRATHHIVSGRMLLADDNLKKWFSGEQLHTMAEAIEDHRASNKYDPRTIYGKIVAEADRLIDVNEIIRRTVQYGLGHYQELTREQQYERTLQHLHEKYAEGGYLKLWIPESSNAAHLEELRRVIRDENEVRRLFDKFFDEEQK